MQNGGVFHIQRNTPPFWILLLLMCLVSSG
jgi:hypothetical protein